MLWLKAVLIIFIYLFMLPAQVGAVQLQATPTAQLLSTPDTNGDTGSNNCMAAALTTALQTLALSEPEIDPTSVTYATVRQVLRKAVPNVKQGINPNYLVAATPQLTKNNFRLIISQVTPTTWDSFLTQELEKGYPVIVHVSDRNTLFNPSSSSTASHVIVVTGIDATRVYFADSWDGKMHSIPKSSFVSAWSKGHYNFLAFTFLKQPRPTSFQEIISRRFNKPTPL